MHREPSIAAVILAAGASTRFGRPKQHVRVGGRTMLEAVVAVADAAGLRPIVAVVPRGLPCPDDVLAVENSEPELGMSRSLQLGIGALPRDVDAAVILLGDQPMVTEDHIARLIAARDGHPFVATVDRHDVAAPPVLIERAAFSQVSDLRGDAGLRYLLRTRSDHVALVSVEEHTPDIDTPADLERLAGG